MAYRRDRLPGGIEGQYLHKKTYSSDRKKVSRFFNPVVAPKNTEKVVEKRTGENGEDVEHVIGKAFKRVHVSFQSTSSCNISTVNELNYYNISCMIRERGRFDNRRYWLI